MTLVEFLAAVNGEKRETQVLSALYWHEHYGTQVAMSAAEVKAALVRARLRAAKAMNVPDVLAKAGANVDTPGNSAGGAKLWSLTETGRKCVRSAHGLPDDEPEIEHTVADLAKVAANIAHADTKAFIDEAILCVSVGGLRAAIVFVWVAAVAELETRMWASGAKAVTAAVQKGNQNAKPLTKKDDLVKLKDVELLQVAEDLGILDKSQKLMLGQALDTRNQCGHPNKYKPGVAKVKSHIEDIAGILWV
jgi:hypothetical protein